MARDCAAPGSVIAVINAPVVSVRRVSWRIGESIAPFDLVEYWASLDAAPTAVVREAGKATAAAVDAAIAEWDKMKAGLR